MEYTKGQINKTGDILKNRESYTDEEIALAEATLTNYRICHAPIINTFQANLRLKLKQLKLKGLVAQRLKRLTSILFKLKREDNMNLARMQDIAGVRVILNNLNDLLLFESKFTASRFKHELLKRTDYIQNPKKSGYRGIHLIYKYKIASSSGIDGLKIEVQIRTKLQHTWATTVETMGTFLDYSLKSSQGPKDILDFFALTSSAFALIEKMPMVPGYEDCSEQILYSKVIEKFEALEIESKLAGFTVAANHISKGHLSAKYYLIVLNIKEKNVKVHSFSKSALKSANYRYTEIEREIEKGEPLQAVLISLDSIESLRKAYPNYFLDTREFIKIIKQIKTKINTVPNTAYK